MGEMIARGLAVAVLTMATAAARADGAVALGVPGDVAKQGIAMGYSVGQPSRAKASQEALQFCRTTKRAPDTTKALCRVVETFSGRCFAFSYDPEDGTAGWGMGIAVSVEEAQQISMQRCRRTAGELRDFCVLAKSACDRRTGGQEVMAR